MTDWLDIFSPEQGVRAWTLLIQFSLYVRTPEHSIIFFFMDKLYEGEPVKYQFQNHTFPHI